MIHFNYNKKRISILLLGLIFFLTRAGAQDIAAARKLWEQRELAAARQQVDEYVILKAGDVDGWILKARILNAISNDPDLKYLVADGKMEAWQAINTAARIDIAATNLRLGTEGFILPLDIYKGLTSNGIAALNAAIETKEIATYVEALNIFKKADQVGSSIYQRGWGLQAIDSNNIFYSARAAIMAGKTGDAEMYSKKIADARIIETYANKGFEAIYQWLVYYYRIQHNDKALANYTAVAKQLYPSSSYYYLNYIDGLREEKQFDKIYTAYQDMFANGFDKAEYKYACLLDLYNYIYTTGQPSSKKESALLLSELTAYVSKNPAEVKGKLLFGKYYMNQAAAAKKELAVVPATASPTWSVYKANITNALRSSNKYLQEIADKFTTTDRGTYNEAVELLVRNFTALGLTTMARKYKAKIK